MRGMRGLHMPASGPRPHLRFEWAFVAFTAWFAAGLYLDGWAHAHIADMETFFTPWHAVLYSGFAATALLLVGMTLRNHRSGYPWHASIPRAYELSLLGAAIFMVAGVGDMTWHIVFGIEHSIDALLSPTHILLAIGGTLLGSGPLRSAWRRPPGDDAGGVLRWGPMVLSFCYLYSVLTFFTQYADPLYSPIASQVGLGVYVSGDDWSLGLGASAILLQTAILVGMVLVLVRRRRFPPGSLALVLGLNALGMTVMSNVMPISVVPLILAAVLAGAVGDVLLLWLRPLPGRPAALRLYAFALPVVFYTFYFAALALDGGIWWTVHFWTGSIIVAGIAGFLLSCVAVPPAVPVEVAPSVLQHETKLEDQKELEVTRR